MNRNDHARFQRQYAVQPDGCWLWKGPTTPNGYGKWRKSPGAPERAAHRISWEHHHLTSVPTGLQLDHLCRNRACVNPEHLEPVTPSENTSRQQHYERARTHCPRGHEYDAGNTRMTRDGKRVCRACDRDRKRAASLAAPDPDQVADVHVGADVAPLDEGVAEPGLEGSG